MTANVKLKVEESQSQYKCVTNKLKPIVCCYVTDPTQRIAAAIIGYAAVLNSAQTAVRHAH